MALRISSDDPFDPDEYLDDDDEEAEPLLLGDRAEEDERLDEPRKVHIPWAMIIVGCSIVAAVALAVANTRSEEERRVLLEKFGEALRAAKGERSPYR